ncbi:SIMPL domain-containing protein [Baaleninema sp.]|uniref:SIMPL domain-containing protein n=1 Tax=Baaleninema sp. TaxID=3101197 RepID=UPI003D01835B
MSQQFLSPLASRRGVKWLLEVGAISVLGIALNVEASLEAMAIESEPLEAPTRLSQLYVGDRPMMTTYGRGIASSRADTAEIRFSFGTTDPVSTDFDSESVQPISEAMLQPVTRAIAALGIPDDNIEVEIDRIDPRTLYPGQPMATVIVTLDNPTFATINAVKDAAETTTLENRSFFLYSSYDTCFVEDFLPLENEARLSAIEDARYRIQAMAEAVNTTVGDILATIEVHSYRPVSSTCTPAAEDSELGLDTPEVEVELGVLLTFSPA